MNYKLLCIFLAINILKAQDEPQVGDQQSAVMEGRSEIITTYESVGVKLTEAEILDQLECFNENDVYERQTQEVKDQIQELFYAAFENRIPDNTKKVLKFNVGEDGIAQLRIVYWRSGTNQHARVQEPNPSPDKKYKLVYKLYRDQLNDDCFRILPGGCTYSGETTDHLEKICKGYDTLAEDLTENIVELSINTEMNPAQAANQMAECIKENVKRFTVEMDCAVEGIEMDHSHALEMLREKKIELESIYQNVVLDEESLKLTYDEISVVDSVNLEVTDEDYQA